jgi:hypothetical protein
LGYRNPPQNVRGIFFFADIVENKKKLNEERENEILPQLASIIPPSAICQS